MAAPTSALAICQKALRVLHVLDALPSDALTNPSGKAATLCAEFYDDSRREVLRTAPWTCIALRAQLTTAATGDNYTGFAYAFTLPTDFIRIIGLTDESGAPLRYLHEAGIIYIDAAAPILHYVPDSEDVDSWDPLLQSAIAYYLASKIAYPLQGSHEDEQAASRAFAGVLQMAQQTTKGEVQPGPEPAEEWTPGLFPRR